MSTGFISRYIEYFIGENCVGLPRLQNRRVDVDKVNVHGSTGLDLSSQIAKSLKTLVAKALNKNQLLLLKEIKNNQNLTITSLIDKVSRECKIPASTLKLNSNILKKLNLIIFFNGGPVILTLSGEFVLNLLGGEKDA